MTDIETTRSPSKRNRVPVSCTECHRRKKKCDRAVPCNNCIERGLVQKCEYKTPLIQQGNTSTAIENRRRLRGKEIDITPESVDALGILNSDLGEVFGLGMHQQLDFDLTILASGNTSSPGEIYGLETRSQTLTLSPKRLAPTVATGLLTNEKIVIPQFINAYSSLPSIPHEPLPKKLLIDYFIARLCPWLSYLSPSLASPNLTWLPYAASHAPLFYATLLVSAVHLNRRRPFRDPSVLIWFKLQTIRLANEKMGLGNREGASNEMILVALVLLYFGILGKGVDRKVLEEYGVHLRGLGKMVEVRGGVGEFVIERGGALAGIVGNWLAVCYGPWKEDFVEGGFEIPDS